MKAQAERKLKLAEEARIKKEKSVLTIQKIARGMIGRMKYRKMLPALKKRLRDRLYCVECENKVAVKRCKQCKDRFCADCFAFVHRTGNRKDHKFETLRTDAKLTNMFNTAAVPTSNSILASAVNSALIAESANKVNLKEWEEYFDDNAKAKYWFNKVTGEASWINPSLHK